MFVAKTSVFVVVEGLPLEPFALVSSTLFPESPPLFA